MIRTAGYRYSSIQKGKNKNNSRKAETSERDRVSSTGKQSRCSTTNQTDALTKCNNRPSRVSTYSSQPTSYRAGRNTRISSAISERTERCSKTANRHRKASVFSIALKRAGLLEIKLWQKIWASILSPIVLSSTIYCYVKFWNTSHLIQDQNDVTDKKNNRSNSDKNFNNLYGQCLNKINDQDQNIFHYYRQASSLDDEAKSTYCCGDSLSDFFTFRFTKIALYLAIIIVEIFIIILILNCGSTCFNYCCGPESWIVKWHRKGLKLEKLKFRELRLKENLEAYMEKRRHSYASRKWSVVFQQMIGSHKDFLEDAEEYSSYCEGFLEVSKIFQFLHVDEKNILLKSWEQCGL